MDLDSPFESARDYEMTDVTEMLRTATVIDSDATENGSSDYIPACGITRRRIEKNQFDLRFLERTLQRAKLSAGNESERTTVVGGRDTDMGERRAFNEMEAARLARGPHSFSQPHSGQAFDQANGDGLTSVYTHAPQVSAPGNAVESEFYVGNVTLEQAGEQICTGLQDVKLTCQRWTDVYAQERFQAFARERKHVVLKLCKTLYDIAQFLYFVGQKADLTQWSERFFVSTVETSLPGVLRCLARLAMYRGCEWMDAAGYVPAQEVHSMLITIWEQKKAMEKYREGAADAELERRLWNALME